MFSASFVYKGSKMTLCFQNATAALELLAEPGIEESNDQDDEESLHFAREVAAYEASQPLFEPLSLSPDFRINTHLRYLTGLQPVAQEQVQRIRVDTSEFSFIEKCWIACIIQSLVSREHEMFFRGLVALKEVSAYDVAVLAQHTILQKPYQLERQFLSRFDSAWPERRVIERYLAEQLEKERLAIEAISTNESERSFFDASVLATLPEKQQPQEVSANAAKLPELPPQFNASALQKELERQPPVVETRAAQPQQGAGAGNEPPGGAAAGCAQPVSSSAIATNNRQLKPYVLEYINQSFKINQDAFRFPKNFLHFDNVEVRDAEKLKRTVHNVYKICEPQQMNEILLGKKLLNEEYTFSGNFRRNSVLECRHFVTAYNDLYKRAYERPIDENVKQYVGMHEEKLLEEEQYRVRQYQFSSYDNLYLLALVNLSNISPELFFTIETEYYIEFEERIAASLETRQLILPNSTYCEYVEKNLVCYEPDYLQRCFHHCEDLLVFCLQIVSLLFRYKACYLELFSVLATRGTRLCAIYGKCPMDTLLSVLNIVCIQFSALPTEDLKIKNGRFFCIDTYERNNYSKYMHLCINEQILEEMGFGWMTQENKEKLTEQST